MKTPVKQNEQVKEQLRQIIREEIQQLNEIKSYPELDKVARKIAKQTGILINKEANKVKSKMPYKSQYILEELIKILEKAV